MIENTQRDLNIALMNELSIIFKRIGIDTLEVLKAAGTKWNFLPFRPGLVGGHCIGVDPYYLTHKAETLGYHPQVILAGRRINDGMGQFVAEQTVKQMITHDMAVKGADIIVLGMTFKENCRDLRNSKVIDVVRELQSYGCHIHLHDPIAESRCLPARVRDRPDRLGCLAQGECARRRRAAQGVSRRGREPDRREAAARRHLRRREERVRASGGGGRRRAAVAPLARSQRPRSRPDMGLWPS